MTNSPAMPSKSGRITGSHHMAPSSHARHRFRAQRPVARVKPWTRVQTPAAYSTPRPVPKSSRAESDDSSKDQHSWWLTCITKAEELEEVEQMQTASEKSWTSICTADTAAVGIPIALVQKTSGPFHEFGRNCQPFHISKDRPGNSHAAMLPKPFLPRPLVPVDRKQHREPSPTRDFYLSRPAAEPTSKPDHGGAAESIAEAISPISEDLGLPSLDQHWMDVTNPGSSRATSDVLDCQVSAEGSTNGVHGRTVSQDNASDRSLGAQTTSKKAETLPKSVVGAALQAAENPSADHQPQQTEEPARAMQSERLSRPKSLTQKALRKLQILSTTAERSGSWTASSPNTPNPKSPGTRRHSTQDNVPIGCCYCCSWLCVGGCLRDLLTPDCHRQKRSTATPKRQSWPYPSPVRYAGRHHVHNKKNRYRKAIKRRGSRAMNGMRVLLRPIAKIARRYRVREERKWMTHFNLDC